LVHAGKYRTENKFKIETIQKLNTTRGKQTSQNSKTKLAWFNHLLQHLAKKKGYVGLFCSTMPRAAHMGLVQSTSENMHLRQVQDV